MSAHLPISPDEAERWSQIAGLRFRLEPPELWVDGVPRPVQPMALRLLGALHDKPGQVLTRRELHARLWPQQSVSDDTLSQLVSRLREAIEPYGHLVVTVRRVGLRLDSPAQRPAASAGPGAAPPRRRRWWAALATLLVICAVAGWWWPDHGPVPGGRGLTWADLRAERDATAQRITQALTLERERKIDAARAQLMQAHQEDPNSALPAIYLAFISETEGRLTDVARWRELAQTRLAARPSLRHQLLLELLNEARAAPTRQALSTLSVAATMGVQAPSLQLGRMHTHLARAERNLALQALRQVDVAALPAREIPGAIADLAALGDRSAALQLLDRLRARLPASDVLEIEARMAASEQRWAAAIAGMDAALAADATAPLRLRTRAGLYRAYAGDYAGARAQWLLVKNSQDPPPSPLALHTILVLLAGLPDNAPAATTEWLTQGAANARENGIASGCWELELIAGLHQLPPSWAPDCPMPAAEEEASFRGLAELRAAFRARRLNDPNTARLQLQAADQLGIADTLFAAHAAALAAQLGSPGTPPIVDPPYPTWSRNVALWHLAQAGRGDVSP